jgi:hypothetical protein
VTPEDDDLPTQRLPLPDEAEEDLSTVRLPTSAIEAIERTAELYVELEQLDLPTIKLPPVAPVLLEAVESPVEATTDALPVELLQPALPFLEAFLPDTAKRLEAQRVARIAAELVSGAPAAVLSRHGLTRESWRLIEGEWTSRIGAELERGETTLRDAYDDAYLEARASHRGPFDARALTELCAELEGRAPDEAPGLEQDVADAMRFKRAEARRRPR